MKKRYTVVCTVSYNKVVYADGPEEARELAIESFIHDMHTDPDPDIDTEVLGGEE